MLSIIPNDYSWNVQLEPAIALEDIENNEYIEEDNY